MQLMAKKGKEYDKRTREFVKTHIADSDVRFAKALQQQQEVNKERREFLRREQKRAREAAEKCEQIMGRKELENLKRIEEHKLRALDVQDNLEFERHRKQQHQDYLLKTEYMRHAFNSEVEAQYHGLITNAKLAT